MEQQESHDKVAAVGEVCAEMLPGGVIWARLVIKCRGGGAKLQCQAFLSLQPTATHGTEKRQQTIVLNMPLTEKEAGDSDMLQKRKQKFPAGSDWLWIYILVTWLETLQLL